MYCNMSGISFYAMLVVESDAYHQIDVDVHVFLASMSFDTVETHGGSSASGEVGEVQDVHRVL